MEKSEMQDTIEAAREKIDSEFGIDIDTMKLGIIPGTGWREGLGEILQVQQTLPFAELHIPGVEGKVSGHKKVLELGEIDNKPVISIGRIHVNENPTNPDLRVAMRIVIEALQNQLKGLVITNAAGTLHDEEEEGLREEQIVKVGDIVIIHDIISAFVGDNTPLYGGEFVDFYNNGIHRANYYRIGTEALSRIQRLLEGVYAYIRGPQFEGPADKRAIKNKGADIIGMSTIQEALVATRIQLGFVAYSFITNGAFGTHSHEENQRIAAENAHKMGDLLLEIVRSWQEPVEWLQR